MIATDLQRKINRADRLREWLMKPTNRMRNTYEVIASDYRKLCNEIGAEESEHTLLTLNK